MLSATLTVNPWACHPSRGEKVFLLPPCVGLCLSYYRGACLSNHVMYAKLFTSKMKSKFSISQSLIFPIQSACTWLNPSWPYFLIIVISASCLSDDKIDFSFSFFLSFFLWLEKNNLICFCIFSASQKLNNISHFLLILTTYCITLQKKTPKKNPKQKQKQKNTLKKKKKQQKKKPPKKTKQNKNQKKNKKQKQKRFF